MFQKRVPSRPPRYKVQTMDGSLIQGSFYRQELQPVPQDSKSQTLFKVKKEIRRRRNKVSGEEEVLIEYDAPAKYIEWVNASQIANGSIIE